MKIPFSIAISAIFLSACGSSSNDEPTPLNDVGSGQASASDPPAVSTAPGDPTVSAGSDSTTSPDSSPVADPVADPVTEASTAPLEDAINGLVTSLAGYRADASIERVQALVTRVSDSSLASRPSTESVVSIDGRYDSLDVTVASSEFDCALGGSLAVGNGIENYYSSEYSADGTYASYRFDGCRLPSDTNGETEVNGSLIDQSLERSGSRFDSREHMHRWTDFALTDDSVTVLEIDGETVIYDENSYFPNADRRVALTLFEERDAGGDALRMSDVSMVLSTSISGGGSIEEYSLEVEGTISDRSTGDVGVAMTSPTALTRARYLGNDPDFALFTDARPFTGEIGLRADDGRYVTVLARDTDTEELYVDLTSVTADGTSSARTNVPFASLTVYPPEDSETAR